MLYYCVRQIDCPGYLAMPSGDVARQTCGRLIKHRATSRFLRSCTCLAASFVFAGYFAAVSGSANASTSPTGPIASSLPAPLLALAAQQAIDTTKSVRISGTVKQAPKTYGVDVDLFANGSSAGTVDVDGAVAHIVIVGKWYYLKGSANFWIKTFQRPPGDAEKLASVWVGVPRPSITGLGANLSMANLRAGFNFSSHPLLKDIGVTEIAHHRASEILISGKGRLWVSTTAPYRPIEFDGTNDGNIVALQFSEWGKGNIPVIPQGAIQYQ